MHPNEDTLNAYADGSLTGAEAAEIERHVASCVSCRQLVDDLREVLRATADLEPRQPPARAWSRIERAIRLEQAYGLEQQRSVHAAEAGGGDEAVQPALTRSWPSWAPLAGLAAAAVLVLATVVG